MAHNHPAEIYFVEFVDFDYHEMVGASFDLETAKELGAARRQQDEPNWMNKNRWKTSDEGLFMAYGTYSGVYITPVAIS